MDTILTVLVAVMVPLSLIIGLGVRRGINGSWIAASADTLNIFLAIGGFFFSFYQYEDGVLRGDSGGLSAGQLIVNTMICASPLSALYLGRLIRMVFRKSYRKSRTRRIYST